MIHPLRPDLTQRTLEVGGYDIRLRKVPAKVHRVQLRGYTPRVQPRKGFSPSRRHAVAVPLERIKRLGRVKTAQEMRKKIGLPADVEIIVTSFHLDEVLETAWRHRKRLAHSLAAAGYHLVTVPNYSVWEQHTRLDNRYAISRTLRHFEDFVEAGVPTLPHVSWLLNVDIDHWIEALRSWPGERSFSTDLATCQSDEDWKWALRGLTRLMQGLDGDWEILVNGVADVARVREISLVCGHIHLVNEHPFQVAMSRPPRPSLLDGLGMPQKSRECVFLAEVAKMDDAVGDLPESCRWSSSPA